MPPEAAPQRHALEEASARSVSPQLSSPADPNPLMHKGIAAPRLNAMEPRDRRTDLILVPTLIAWVAFMVAGSLLVIDVGSPWLLASWALSGTIVTLAIIGALVFRASGMHLDLDIARPIVLHRRRSHEPGPPDLPLSDDEYAEIRKRYPFVGLVRSGHTDTSEIMSDNPAPARPARVSTLTISSTTLTETRTERRRAKA